MGARGVAAAGSGCVAVTTTDGRLYHYWPRRCERRQLAEGLDQPYGVALAPSGEIAFAEYGAGRVLLVGPEGVTVLGEGLQSPVDVAFGPDGACLVSEAGAGKVTKLTSSGTEMILEGLEQPHGLAVQAGTLYVLDAGAKAVIGTELDSGKQFKIATNLPVGAPPNVVPKPLRRSPSAGPVGQFSGLAAGQDGLYISADGEGSILALRKRTAH